MNWETLNKNLVTFKIWDGIRMRDFNFIRVHENSGLYMVGNHEKLIYKREFSKNGRHGQLADSVEGARQKGRRRCF